LVTPRKNKYLLTFIDHFSKWVEAYPIPDITAENCESVLLSDPYLTWHRIHFSNRPGQIIYVRIL